MKDLPLFSLLPILEFNVFSNEGAPAMESAHDTPKTASPINKLKVFLILVILGAAVAALLLLPIRTWLFDLLHWLQPLGFWGPLILAGFYILACVCFLPGWILTVGAGFLFGLGLGTATVSLGSTLGATAAFFLGRTLARPWVEKWMMKHPRWHALDASLAAADFKLVLLLRLSPLIPFNVLNYALGATRVRPTRYVLASWLGMLPGTVLYVYLGTAARSLAELATQARAASPLQTVFFWVGLVITFVTATYITRLAARTLRSSAVPTGSNQA
jgi:uncharacterized membrane protein YdjX (TVP38/TMEM64 family)